MPQIITLKVKQMKNHSENHNLFIENQKNLNQITIKFYDVIMMCKC
ncbi:MAG: hypothetical protein RL619_1763 [Bacteroidota bacterium]